MNRDLNLNSSQLNLNYATQSLGVSPLNTVTNAPGKVEIHLTRHPTCSAHLRICARNNLPASNHCEVITQAYNQECTYTGKYSGMRTGVGSHQREHLVECSFH